MQGFVHGSILLVALFLLARVVVWLGQVWFEFQDQKRSRDFRRNLLLSEAFALRASRPSGSLLLSCLAPACAPHKGRALDSAPPPSATAFDSELWDRR